jgi:hypothetical protein
MILGPEKTTKTIQLCINITNFRLSLYVFLFLNRNNTGIAFKFQIKNVDLAKFFLFSYEFVMGR